MNTPRLVAFCRGQRRFGLSADVLRVGWLRRLPLALLIAVAVLPASPPTAWAALMGEPQARTAVQGWLTRESRALETGIAGRVARVETYLDVQGQPLYYVASLDPTGFVIVSADDEVEPIIAFAAEGAYEPLPDNPLMALTETDLAARVWAVRQGAKAQQPAGGRHRARWLQLAEEDVPSPAPAASTISDVRVAPLVKSRWNQGSAYGNYCYNYYTPNHYVCGCVATALAQILRFHQHPTTGIGVREFQIKVDVVSQAAYTRGGDGAGGPYDWAQTPLVASSGMTMTQRQAIGALCYDAGVAVRMSYAPGGSGASTSSCRGALTGTFGYGCAYYDNASGPWEAPLNANLDAGLPCMMSITSSTAGHAVVVDGYGYSGQTAYHHINLGWGGSSDAWYNLPTVTAGGYQFTAVSGFVCNIFVAGSGEIISGRVTDADGYPLADVTVTATRSGGGVYTAVTNAKGIYAVAKVPSQSQYALTAAGSGYTFADRAATTGSSDSGYRSGNVWGVNFIAGLRGDIDGDGQVNVFDIFVIAEHWNAQAGQPGFDPACDLDGDGAINVFDIFVLAENWNG